MKKIGRNDPCPCGSGKKYKQCCGPNESVQPTRISPPNLSTANLLQEAIAHHQAGRLPEAEAIYRQILQAKPNDPDALHLLGVMANQVGKNEIAIELIGKALMFKPDFAEGHNNLGNALTDLGRLDDAVICYRQAIKLKPDFAEARNNLGTVHKDQGRLEEAMVCYRQTLQFKPNYAEAHNNLGNVLKDLGRVDEAIASFRQAIACRSDYVDAYINLGNLLKDQGKLDEAIAQYRLALTFKPDFAELHNDLGNAYKDQGKLDDAIACYQQALRFKADSAETYVNLGNAFKDQDKLNEAIACFKLSLQIKETTEAKVDFAACIKNLSFVHDDPELRSLLIRALSEPWARPADLYGPSVSLIRLNSNIDGCIKRANDGWPARLPEEILFANADFTAVGDDRLFQSLLENVAVCDVELERFLTMVRLTMLNAASHAVTPEEKKLAFYCALARQCFINEYVFSYTEEEFHQALSLHAQLAAALTSASPFPLLWLICVAAYFPLLSLPSIETVLDQSWPDAINALLAQQIREPKEEQQYRIEIPYLTAIDDDVSQLVKQQYEENPYPRWTKAPSRRNRFSSFDAYLRWKFPLVPIKPLGTNEEIDILVAGCGTGWQPIQTAQQFPKARILAIDLSLTSLSYAKRKTRELGLENIEYACADIMKLESIGRSFDVIESSGVLHHLADPLAGWQELLSLLRPNGFMHLGFYSEHARRSVVEARKFIAEKGYGSSAADIRRCRQDLIAMGNDTRFTQLQSFSDFYGTSECRDLLFHVQEHRFTLPQLKEIFAEFHLEFIGFSLLEQQTLRKYEARFPDDAPRTNLDYWNIFEIENPNTFSRMYQFFLQK